MRRHPCCASLLAALVIGLIEPASAQHLTTMYAFPGSAQNSPRWPRGGLAMDPAGELWGTTHYGGNCETCGILYRLFHLGNSPTWTYDPAYNFNFFMPTPDGIAVTAPLTIVGNAIYGTASAGGDPNCGCGSIFSFPVTPPFTYSILHQFGPYDFTNKDWPLGTTPIGGLLIDTDGTMYGTTNAGGLGQPGSENTQGAGVLYKFSNGTYSKLHDFDGEQNGGPQGELIFGADGAIYGTQFGGDGGDPTFCQTECGAIFRINKDGSNYQVLYTFLGSQAGNSHDGAHPEGRLALGSDGTIYGTTSFGGTASDYGTAWSIKQVNGNWTYNQLFTFDSTGSQPHSGLILARDGALYGTAASGGSFQCGAIYRLLPPTTAGGSWTYQLLHSFKCLDADGDTPYGDLLYANGKFYGGNLTGGNFGNAGCTDDPDGCGTLFEFVPPATPHDFNSNSTSDILWKDTSGNLAMWLMSNGQFSSGATISNVGTSWQVVGTRDFNNDGHADILWLDGSGDLAVWLMNGTALSSGIGLGNVGANWTVAGTGDFNGDGTGDILWHNTSTGDYAIWLMSNGQYSSGIDLGSVNSNWSVAGTGDFNGYGITDILWRNTSTGDLAIWFMSNGQMASGIDIGVVPLAWSVVGTGDFNADGVSDIVWRDTSGNLAIWLMNSSGQEASGLVLGQVPTTWSVAETGDFNGDAKSDLLWIDQSGDLGVWLMNGLTVSSTIGLGNVGTIWTVQGANAD